MFIGIQKIQAQSTENLEFVSKTHDFGEIKEVDGDAEHEFRFKNISGAPIVISKVQASCGCTTPDWTKDTIAVGDYGFVKARYSTVNRPGSFKKSLTVYIQSDNAITERLYIVGEVIPRPKDVEEQFPVQLGALRFTSRIFNLGRVKTTKEPTIKEFEIYNERDSILIISDSVLVPPFVKVEFMPHLLRIGEKGKIVVTYDAKKANDLGFMNHNITFFTSEEGDEGQKSISLYANIEEYFPVTSAKEREKLPVLYVEKTTFDAGKINSGDKAKGSYTLKNTGKSELIIRKIEPNCSCIDYKLSSSNLLPGQSADLKVVFNSERRKGNQQKSVTVYVNSPKNPVIRLLFLVKVESED